MKNVYMCISADVIHGGHIKMIRNAAALGELTVGILTDEEIIKYKQFPVLSYDARKTMIENIKGVSHVVCQRSLCYAENLRNYKPDIVVHGDDWKVGIQASIRDEVISVLNEIGGELTEFPYSDNEEYLELERYAKGQLSLPDMRRKRLKQLLKIKPFINVIEAHSGLTGLIAEKTVVNRNGEMYQFDAMWVSSLCDSTEKGKPDIELVDMTSRIRTMNDIMEVTSKPIILDGDTGGITEHFVYNIRTLERMGVSAIIIEDKTGLKKNSLLGNTVLQEQESIENFCEKITAGKRAQKTDDFMIIARIESLILEKGLDDALKRACAYVEAGADGIMIHSRKKEPDEVFEFMEQFRTIYKNIPIVVVPTTYNTITGVELSEKGASIIIYANQMIRSGFPAMKKAAETILKHDRASEADKMCMSIKDILELIPDEGE